MPRTSFASSSAFAGSSARTRGYRRARAVASKLRKNMPVRRALARPGKTIAKGNRTAIYTLGKQVKNLQLSQHGVLRRQIQSCNLLNNIALMRPTNTTPLFMNVSDFYNNSYFYQGSVDITGTPQSATSQTMTKQTFDLDLKNSYQFNEQVNSNVSVNQQRYLPISTNLKFTLSGTIPAGYTRPVRYRITLFRTKRQPLTSTIMNVAMPNAAGALWHMSEDDPTIRNHFSKKYHQVIQDKWVTIMPAKSAGNTIPVYRSIELPYSFGRKTPLEVNIDTQDPPGQRVYTNLPEDEIVWCLISCNSPGANGINITFQRTNVWRDQPYNP